MSRKLKSPVKNGILTPSGQQHKVATSIQVEPPLLIAETIESYFYAYRLTGNNTDQDRAWQAFQHVSIVTRAQHGYSAIQDVMTPAGCYRSNIQEIFWLAETLKYLYLIFDHRDRVSLNDWVFNTEAHSWRRGRKVKSEEKKGKYCIFDSMINLLYMR
jgi:mannosyl-oligosaccharide alpha-1,2-mannosidase